jgi:quercetin dioxygenase-like cupin family protein
MSQTPTYRRVITGLDESGRSSVVIDAPVSSTTSMSGRTRVIWRTDSVPADNTGRADIDPGHVDVNRMGDGGTLFMIHSFPPDREGEPFWHTTDTIDYITMLDGEVVFMTETGEVTLRAGDVMVDRGIKHAWRNDSDKDATAAIVVLPAHPLRADA